MKDLDQAAKLLQAADTGAARCLAHGHTFDGDREPVIVEKAGGTLEVWCRECADYYDQEIVR